MDAGRGRRGPRVGGSGSAWGAELDGSAGCGSEGAPARAGASRCVRDLRVAVGSVGAGAAAVAAESGGLSRDKWTAGFLLLASHALCLHGVLYGFFFLQKNDEIKISKDKRSQFQELQLQASEQNVRVGTELI